MSVLVQRLRAALCRASAGAVSWTFPPTALSVRRARHQARAQVEQWGFDRQSEVVELLVSELVTNAVRYGSGQIRLIMSVEDGLLRCAVEDSGPDEPHMRPMRWDDERGRGMHLVDMLAYRWGSDSTARGKVVWFQLLVRSRARRREAVGAPAPDAR